MILMFDCDGVILDSMVLHTEVEAEAYNGLGANVTQEELSRRFSGVSQEEVSRIIGKEAGINIPIGFEDIIEESKKSVFEQRLKAISGINQMLEDLKDIPRCIASGSGTGELKHMLNIVGLYDSFEPHIYSADMVDRGKPSPDLFLYAAKRTSYEPHECIVIEDGVSGVQAGIAAGMRVLGFTGGSHCGADHSNLLMKAGAELIFNDMNDLSNIINERIKL